MDATLKRDSSGTTCASDDSKTAHVRMTVNSSPIVTAPVLDWRQQRIGSTAGREPGSGIRDPGDCAKALEIPNKRIAITRIPVPRARFPTTILIMESAPV